MYTLFTTVINVYQIFCFSARTQQDIYREPKKTVLLFYFKFEKSIGRYKLTFCMLTVGIHVYPCCKFDFRTQIKIICTPLLNTMLFTTRYSGISREIKKRFQSFLYGFVDCIPWCRYFQYERRPPRCTRDKCFEFFFFFLHSYGTSYVWRVYSRECVFYGTLGRC